MGYVPHKMHMKILGHRGIQVSKLPQEAGLAFVFWATVFFENQSNQLSKTWAWTLQGG